MTSARRHTACGTTVWRAIAARLLALALILASLVPAPGLAEDPAFHDGRHGSVTEMAAVGPEDRADAAGPCPVCHVQCGCHQALPAGRGPAASAPEAARASYVRLSEAAPRAIVPDGPRRPPRA